MPLALIVLLGALFSLQLAWANAQQLMLDPGHSRHSPGATACSGEKENNYNQALAKSIHKTLSQAGISSSLTTDYTQEPSLTERASLAQGYDLLISLHHDSVQPQFVSRNGRGGVCSDKASGFSIFVSNKNPAYLQSLDYATRLAKALVARGLTPTLHHSEPIPGENRTLLSAELGIYRFDELQVLKLAPSPAILLEAAVIVNQADEAHAATQAYRTLIAEAILETIRQGARQ